MFKRYKTNISPPTSIYITIHKEDDIFLYHVHTINKVILKRVGDVIMKDDGFLILQTDRDRVEGIIKEELPTVVQHWTSDDIQDLIMTDLKDMSMDISICPDGVKIESWTKSYDYQKRAVYDTIYRYDNKVLLSFAVGLGKTLTASMILSHWQYKYPGIHLIISPSGLKANFYKELLKWSSFAVEDIQTIKTGKSDIKPDVKILIMSFSIATSRIKEINKLNISSVIIDESHALKSVTSNRSKTLIPFMIKMKRMILITATPLTSRSIEILTTLRILFPNIFKNLQSDYYSFAYRYCGATTNAYGYFEAKKSTNTHELNLILNKCMIRINHDDIEHMSFPGQDREMIKLDGGKEARKILSNGLKKLNSTKAEIEDSDFLLDCKKKRSMKYFAALMKMTMEAKIKHVMEYLEYFFINETNRYVIFAYNQQMMDSIQELLIDKEIKHIRIDGNVLPNKRQNLVDSFIQDNECKTALLSIAACNSGLNIMTREDHLIPITTAVFTQLSWIPSDLIQCEGRIRRSGGIHDVIYKYLILDGSFETTCWRVLENKSRNTSSVLDNESKDMQIDIYKDYVNE